MTVFRKKLAISAVIGLAFAGFGCNPDDEKAFQRGGGEEFKPNPTQLSGDADGSSFGAREEASEVARVRYGLKVESNSETVLCRGQVDARIMSNFDIKLPTAKISCASLTVDLGSLLATQGGGGLGSAGGGGLAGGAEGNLGFEGRVMTLKKIANAEFDPPRPFLLGPIVQNPKIYKDYRRSSDHRMTASNPNTGQSYSGNGTFDIEVFNHNTSYNNESIDKGFENIMHWEMRAEGFDDIPVINGLIFPKWTWWWNTRPIMVAKVQIVGRVGDVIEAQGDLGDLADDIVGDLKITLTVQDWELL